MLDYTKYFPNEKLIRGKYATGLFTDSIDEDRIRFLEDQTQKSGYVNMEFTAGVHYDYNTGNFFIDSDKDQSKWNEFWFGTKYVGWTYSPIEIISEGDLYLPVKNFANKYYVDPQDVPQIIENAKLAYSKDERPVLLRFAVTDYYSSTARFDYAEEDAFDMSAQDGYVAQQTVFLDFDVLSMGFQSEDGYMEIVIPVVAKPIDIINDLTPPEDLVEEQEWWQKLVAILLLILLIVILNLVFPAFGRFCGVIWNGIKSIFEWIWKVITFPFRIKLLKSIIHKKPKKKTKSKPKQSRK